MSLAQLGAAFLLGNISHQLIVANTPSNSDDSELLDLMCRDYLARKEQHNMHFKAISAIIKQSALQAIDTGFALQIHAETGEIATSATVTLPLVLNDLTAANANMKTFASYPLALSYWDPSNEKFPVEIGHADNHGDFNTGLIRTRINLVDASDGETYIHINIIYLAKAGDYISINRASSPFTSLGIALPVHDCQIHAHNMGAVKSDQSMRASVGSCWATGVVQGVPRIDFRDITGSTVAVSGQNLSRTTDVPTCLSDNALLIKSQVDSDKYATVRALLGSDHMCSTAVLSVDGGEVNALVVDGTYVDNGTTQVNRGAYSQYGVAHIKASVGQPFPQLTPIERRRLGELAGGRGDDGLVSTLNLDLVHMIAESALAKNETPVLVNF